MAERSAAVSDGPRLRLFAARRKGAPKRPAPRGGGVGRGGSGRSGPFGRSAMRYVSVPERPETRLRLLVDVPRRIQTRESWAFAFKIRSLPKAWAHGTALALPCGRERNTDPATRRLSMDGGRRPGWSRPPPAFPDPRNAPLRQRERGRDRNIFRICQGPRMEDPWWPDANASPYPARGRSNAHILLAPRRPGRACPGHPRQHARGMVEVWRSAEAPAASDSGSNPSIAGTLS